MGSLFRRARANGTLDHTTLAGADKLVLQRAGNPVLITVDEYKAFFRAHFVAGSRATETDLANAGTVPNAMARYKAAIAAANTTPLHWLAIGDSLTEGLNPGTSSAGFIDDRWITRLAAAIRSRRGLSAGGVGFVNTVNNCANGSTAGTAYWTFSGGGSTSTDARAFGHQTVTSPSTSTLHYTGTSFRLQYTLGTSAFTVAVDGGAPVTVTPAAGSTYQGAYSSPVLTHGTHTAVITGGAVHGAHIYDGDETTGVHLWDNSQSGQLAVLDQFYTPTDQLSANLCVNPALVTIAFPINDFLGHQSTASVVSAYQSIIATVKSLCTITPSFLLIFPHEYGGDSGYSPTWAQYITALKTVVAADPFNVSWVDMSALMVSPTAGNSYSSGKCNTDMVHLTSTGNQFWSSQIDAALAVLAA